MKIVFFGTPQFAADILEQLIESKTIEIEAIVTREDKPIGRSGTPQPPPVKILASRLIPQVPLYQPRKCSDLNFAHQIAAFEAELFVVAAYGEILKSHVLEAPTYGCINVHASLLPKYRGAAPIQRALMEGERETGVTIIQLVKEMDAGDILKKVSIPISLDANSGELMNQLASVGAEALIEVLHGFEEGLVTATPQENSLATFAPKITPDDCRIKWEKDGLRIHNQVRALSPKPGAWCEFETSGKRKRAKILKTYPSPSSKGSPGEVVFEDLTVACGSGGVHIQIIQPEGKRAMCGKDFLRGHGASLKFC